MTFESEPGVKINEDIQIYNETSYEYTVADNGNTEIDERVVTANENMNDIGSLQDPADEGSIKDRDWTFIPEESSSDESVVDDAAIPDISEINSEDFEFNSIFRLTVIITWSNHVGRVGGQSFLYFSHLGD